MKRIFGVFSACLVLFLIFTSSVVYSEELQCESASDVYRYLLPETGEELLDDSVNFDSLKSYLHTQFRLFTSSIDISSYKIPYSTENLYAISKIVREEMIEDFHVSLNSYWHNSSYITILDITYLCSKDDFPEKNAIWQKSIDNILEGIVGNDSLTDVQKALLIHDRIALNCEYDLREPVPDESFCSYGVLINHVAVCQGYSEVYKYLLGKVGIEAYVCTSDALHHAWNIIKIGDEYYYVDVTWDDPIYDISGRVNHNYFMLSTEEFMKSHNANDYDTTPTDTSYDEYFWQSSSSAFQLVDGEIYYIDGINNTLNTYDGTVLTDVCDYWPAGGNLYWRGNFSRLCYDGQNLYYSLSDRIYKYDIKNKKSEIAYTPEQSFGDNFRIYGLKYEDGKLICEYYNSPQFKIDTKDLYSVVLNEEVDNGYSISGIINSFNPNNPITVKLVSDGEEKYTITIPAKGGRGEYDTDFEITGVSAGKYDLVITKICHLTYKIKNIIVSDSDIDLRTSEKEYSCIKMLAGDVDGNESINPEDVVVIRYPTNMNLNVNNALIPSADVNGDGFITPEDVQVVRYTNNMNNSSLKTTFDY